VNVDPPWELHTLDACAGSGHIALELLARSPGQETAP
jgi:16S rRNA G966 N2-methylase RsmD